MVPAVAFQSGAVKHHMICIVYGCAAAPLAHTICPVAGQRGVRKELTPNRRIKNQANGLSHIWQRVSADVNSEFTDVT